ncbi:YihY/virulence factor BrkB family protein [Naumannella sp. ID2617S]|nr:YihY/virulence factor BrkB family protein [Naumannella sp. ID2617S]
MVTEGTAAAKADTPDPDDPRKPAHPHQVRRRGWRLTAKNAFSEFFRDQGTDLAAALTYYGVLAIFPGLLAVFSLLGLVGQAAQTVDTVLQLLAAVAPRELVDQARGPLTSMATSRASGITFVAGLLGALWSASGYVGAFSRMMNRVYEVDEGRGLVKLRLQQLVITVVVLVLAAVLLVGLVVSGPIAERFTWLIGLGVLGRQVFNIVKWPLLLLLAVILVAVLYYFTPNVRQPKFRWLSVGALVALLVWILLSLAFGLYVGNFASYNKSYGALGGIIVFLLWLWITNCALVMGAEIDSELERSRQLQAGIHAEESLQLPPRDTKASEKQRDKREQLIAEGRAIREAAYARGEVEFTPEEARDDTAELRSKDAD